MKVTVLTSAGEEDEWSDITDVVPDNGYLYIVTKPKLFTPEDKIFTVTEEPSRQFPGIRTGEEKTTEYRLEALYAPGMWMKVEFG